MMRMAPGINELEREAAKEFNVVRATGVPKPNFHIPGVFADTIALHIVKNNLDDRLQPPLMLIIQGPPGEGKSAQTAETCSRLGVDLVVVPGSSLSGVQEKDPVLILRAAYLFASATREVGKRRAAVLIEDLDTSIIATHVGRSYTVNTQLLSGAIMYLCQDPYHFGDRRTERVPLLATGNDFTTVAEPLVRHGRAVFFDWTPDLKTKIEVVRTMFTPHLEPIELDRIGLFVEHFSGEHPGSIAFFDQVRHSIYDDVILERVRFSDRIDFSDIRLLVEVEQPRLTIERLIELGERVYARGPRRFLRDETE